MTLDDLIAVGAPALPEGYFYRVVETQLDGTWVHLRRRTRFGSRHVMRDLVRLNEHVEGYGWVVIPVGYAIGTAARRCFEQGFARDELSAWIGDYPSE